MNLDQFYVKLKRCVSSIFHELEHLEDIFEFGVFADQDLTSFYICYNTREHFASQLKEEFLNRSRIVSHYRWLLQEWYGAILYENKILAETNDILYNIIVPKEAQKNEYYKKNIEDVFFKVLIDLKKEGLFCNRKSELIVYFEVDDSYIGEGMEIMEQIKVLVGDTYYEEFLLDIKKIFM